MKIAIISHPYVFSNLYGVSSLLNWEYY